MNENDKSTPVDTGSSHDMAVKIMGITVIGILISTMVLVVSMLTSV